jgi:hypothetical protein
VWTRSGPHTSSVIFNNMKKISIILLISTALIGCVSSTKGSEGTISPDKEKHPIAITIAVNKTASYHFQRNNGKLAEHPNYTEDLPYIHGDSFSVAIINVTKEDIKIPRSSDLTLKLIDSNGKEYLLSEHTPGFGSSVRRSYAAHILEPQGCLIYRVNMDWYKFPKSLFRNRQKVKLQAIYKAPEIVKNVTIKRLRVNPNPEKRKIELTKDLKLWHGEVRSPLREFLFYWYDSSSIDNKQKDNKENAGRQRTAAP